MIKLEIECDDETIYQNQSPGTLTIHEDEPELFSGLYDHQGQPLYRTRQKIGFI